MANKLKGRFATMVPLVHQTRTEHLIAYFSADWEDLVSLFEAPVEFLRSQQFLWKQEAAHSISWQLLVPVNATVECGFSNPITLGTVLGILGEKQLNLGGKPPLNKAILDAAYDRLQNSFAVLFATYTNSIRVVYFPPDPTDKKKKPVQHRYKGGISDSTMVIVDWGGLSYSNIHFDLVDSSHRMRADFVVNHLEDPQRLADLLTHEVQQGRMHEAPYKLHKASTTPELISMPKSVPKAIHTGTKFHPGIDLSADTKATTDVELFVEKFKIFPAMEVHNLSDPVECSVCSNLTANVVKGPGGVMTVGLGSAIVEAYQSIMYDPASALQRVDRRDNAPG